jgi:hypothetical protein
MDADDFDDDELLLLKLEEEEHIVIAAATAVMDAGRAVMDYAQTHYNKTPASKKTIQSGRVRSRVRKTPTPTTIAYHAERFR